MLPYVLAWVVGLGSLAIYLAAFFFPEIHRKNDFIWSGMGLFYALILWIYADRLRGGLLLGETAGVALLCWFSWQTLTLRRQQTPLDQQTPLPDTAALQERLSSLTQQLQERLGALSRTSKQPEKSVSSAAKTEEVLEVAEEIAEIEEKLDAAVAESIAATKAEARSSSSEAGMVLPPPIAEDIEQTSPAPQAAQPQVEKGDLPAPASMPFNLSQLRGRASQAFATAKEAFQGIPKLLKPNSKSKPVWVRPTADSPAEPATPNQEAAVESPILAEEKKVAEAPEPVESPQEITEGAISEAEVPTLAAKSEPPAQEGPLETGPEQSDPTFEAQEAQIVEALADTKPAEFSVEEIAPQTGMAPPAEPVQETPPPQAVESAGETELPSVHSSLSPEAVEHSLEDIEGQATHAPTPPDSSPESTGSEESAEKPQES